MTKFNKNRTRFFKSFFESYTSSYLRRVKPPTRYKEEYAKRLMTDAQIMDALTGDIYGIGRVIATNKFKYLRYSYMTFLVGISLAIGIFSFQIIEL